MQFRLGKFFICWARDLSICLPLIVCNLWLHSSNEKANRSAYYINHHTVDNDRWYCFNFERLAIQFVLYKECAWLETALTKYVNLMASDTQVQ